MAVRSKTTAKAIALSSNPANRAVRLFILAGVAAAALAAAILMAGAARAGGLL